MQKRIVLLGTVFAAFVFTPMAMAQPAEVRTEVHSVWAQKPLYMTDGDTGMRYTLASGTASMNWKDGTRYGFFQAVAVPITPLPVITRYEFILVSVGSSTSDLIVGLWDIYKNGRLVCNACVGKAYGVDLSPGNYFKLYVGDSTSYSEKWHFSAYITNRLDY